MSKLGKVQTRRTTRAFQANKAGSRSYPERLAPLQRERGSASTASCNSTPNLRRQARETHVLLVKVMYKVYEV